MNGNFQIRIWESSTNAQPVFVYKITKFCMPFATHFPNDDQPPWHLSFLEFIGLVINCLWCTIKEY